MVESSRPENLNGKTAELAADATLLIAALRATLTDKKLGAAYREVVLTLPSETMIAEQLAIIEPQAIHNARQALRRALATALRSELEACYKANQIKGAYRTDAQSAGKRALANCALDYLAELDDAAVHTLAQKQFDHANNMTNRLAALDVLINTAAPGRQKALAQFYKEFAAEPLVIDKWFMLQGTAKSTDVATVRQLMQHPAFSMTNPNRARSLIFSFCNNNPAQFHAADGSGYAFWAEQVIALNSINPQVAARLARTLDRWRKFAPIQQAPMRSALQQVAAAPALSNDVLEVITKALNN